MMRWRFTDAKLISYLLKCHSAIFVNKKKKKKNTHTVATTEEVTASERLPHLGLSLMLVLPFLNCETEL